MAKPTIFINDIDSWHKNGTFPTFNNTYDEESDTNALTYQGGNIYERIYLPIKCTANQQVVFSAKFCSPSGYSCSYGDNKEYFAITSNKPSDTSALSSQTVVASTPLDGSASSTPVLYTVTYTPTTDTTLYLVIDFGYMVDGVQTSLIYQEITLEGAVPDTSGIWYVDNNRLTHNDLPEPLTAIMQPPYPSFWWYVDNGRLVNSNLPAPVVRGAFANCKSLDTAHIPESVKNIGQYAFRNTALESVKIALDCDYSETSFPDDCEIEHYTEPESEDDNSG